MFAVCSPHSAIEANSFIRLAGQLVFFASIKCVNFFVCGSVYVLNGETRSLLSSALQSSHTCLALRRRFSSRKQSFLPQAHAQVATDGADFIPHFWRRAATHFRRVRCKHTTAPSVTSWHVAHHKRYPSQWYSVANYITRVWSSLFHFQSSLRKIKQLHRSRSG